MLLRQVFALSLFVAGLTSSLAFAGESEIAAPKAEAATAQPAAATAGKTDDERMVCTLEKTLGSNRKQRVCRSVEQVRKDREAAREQMERRGVCSTCGGGG